MALCIEWTSNESCRVLLEDHYFNVWVLAASAKVYPV